MSSAATMELRSSRSIEADLAALEFEANAMRKVQSKTSLSSAVSVSTGSSDGESYALDPENEVESEPEPRLAQIRPEGSAMKREMMRRKHKRIHPTDPEFFQRLERIWKKEDAKLDEPEGFLSTLIWTPLLLTFRVIEFWFTIVFWPVKIVSKLVTGEKMKQVDFWNVPMVRRKQTLAILFYYVLFLFIPLGHVFGTFFVLFPLTTFPMLCYYVWIFKWDSSAEDGSRVPFAKDWKVWRYLVSYFPCRLVKTGNLDPRERYVFAYHPHGIISFGAFSNFATNATGWSSLFPGVDLRLCTLKQSFYSPWLRELMLSLGLVAASAKSCQNCLNKGKSVCLVVGGAQEALESEPGTYRLHLHRRKGFVRQALLGGADLVPCIGFGENDIYTTKYLPKNSMARKIQEFLKKHLGFSTPIFYGRGIFNYSFGILPHRKPIFTVVGKPVKLPRLPHHLRNNNFFNTPEGIELVDKCHQKYTIALKDLWNTYKGKLAIDRQGTLQLN